jgi:hypothetical protein
MKNLSLVLILSITLLCCRKSDSSDTVQKLIRIESDSAGAWNLGYTNNQITSLHPTPGSLLNGADNIQYINTDSCEYITINQVKFAINHSKLPIKIYRDNNIFINFFYRTGTNMLDSVIWYNPNNLANDAKKIFRFTYSGQNIVNINAYYFANSTYSTIRENYTFSYGNASNIFRTSDSLLHVFSYPSSFGELPTDAGLYFAETFSESTFNKMTIDIDSNDPQFGYQVHETFNMSYNLNNQGKITAENFDNGPISRKRYFYQ